MKSNENYHSIEFLAPSSAIATTVPENIVTNINNNPDDKVANRPIQTEKQQQTTINCEFALRMPN